MDDSLKEELDYFIDILVKSGFFNEEDIREILEEQFIEEDINIDEIPIELIENSNSNFSILKEAFEKLADKNIIAIHNCGYDLEEDVGDAFELAIHLRNNSQNPEGFCFYTFEDIEEAIFDSKLRITFGDFDEDENKALIIGKTIEKLLKDLNFKIDRNQTVNEQITINPFIWDKSYNENEEFEMEGAYETYMKRCNSE